MWPSNYRKLQTLPLRKSSTHNHGGIRSESVGVCWRGWMWLGKCHKIVGRLSFAFSPLIRPITPANSSDTPTRGWTWNDTYRQRISTLQSTTMMITHPTSSSSKHLALSRVGRIIIMVVFYVLLWVHYGDSLQLSELVFCGLACLPPYNIAYKHDRMIY